MRKDLELLRSSIQSLRVDVLGMIKADEEFMRLWSLYEKLRQDLINVDASLFDELRELSKPPTEKNQGYGDYQVADRDHVKALFSEITKAGEYLEIVEQSYAKAFGKPDTFTACVYWHNDFIKSHVSLGSVIPNARPSKLKMSTMFKICFTPCFGLVLMILGLRSGHRATLGNPQEWTSCSKLNRLL